MRCFNKNKLVTRKILLFKKHKILQLKHIYNLEVRKFMYKYTNSQLSATFNDYFKVITDVHPYNTKC